jgi:phosphatidylserine/phosphatidylglycerophosphate/cardiolipin synthase-like enzyme
MLRSQVLVVDDRVAIVGSASISDRGMRGDRNSEVSVNATGVVNAIVMEGFMNALTKTVFPHKIPANVIITAAWLLLIALNTDLYIFIHSCTPTYRQVAVRIEDATLIEVPYDGAKFVVGFAPWALRTNLMKAHLGSDSIGISILMNLILQEY